MMDSMSMALYFQEMDYCSPLHNFPPRGSMTSPSPLKIFNQDIFGQSLVCFLY